MKEEIKRILELTSIAEKVGIITCIILALLNTVVFNLEYAAMMMILLDMLLISIERRELEKRIDELEKYQNVTAGAVYELIKHKERFKNEGRKESD